MNKQVEKAALVYDKCRQIPVEKQIELLQNETILIQNAIGKTMLWIKTFPKNKLNTSYFKRIGSLMDIQTDMQRKFFFLQDIYLNRKEAS